MQLDNDENQNEDDNVNINEDPQTQQDNSQQVEMKSDDPPSNGEEQDRQDDQFTQQYQSDCLLSFRVFNDSSSAKTISLKISPKFDENGNQLPLNFRLPQSEILCEVYSNSSSKYVIHLTKLNPAVDTWGEFDWSFKMVEKKVDAQLANNGSNWQNQYAGYGSTGDQNMYGELAQDDTGDVMAGADEKACPVCTFLNPINNLTCECCGSNM
jgi:hypothetical protein